eukprot:scaffold158271_cov14-Tisochrysis_lutea.AAC.2
MIKVRGSDHGVGKPKPLMVCLQAAPVVIQQPCAFHACRGAEEDTGSTHVCMRVCMCVYLFVPVCMSAKEQLGG